MAISLLGKSPADFTWERPDSCLLLETVMTLIPQILTCVEQLHRRNLVRRDIKPENFAMGRSARASQIFIIDFGLSKPFCSRKMRAHIPFITGKDLTGTARYASVAALRGCEQSHRNDMEALEFVWLFLLSGSLPWMGLAGSSGQHKHNKVLAVKAATSFEDVCTGFPDEFVRYFHAVRQLNFADEPEYLTHKRMVRELFISLRYVADFAYDWRAVSAPAPSKVKVTQHSSGRVKKPAPPTGAHPPRKLIITDNLPAAIESSIS
jgi:casein kinase 1